MPADGGQGRLDRWVPTAIASSAAQGLNAFASGLAAVFVVTSRTDGVLLPAVVIAALAQAVVAGVVGIGTDVVVSGRGRARIVTAAALARVVIILGGLVLLDVSLHVGEALGLVVTSVVFTWTWLLLAGRLVAGTRADRATFAERYEAAVADGLVAAANDDGGPLSSAAQAAQTEHAIARARLTALATREGVSTEADIARELLAVADELHEAANDRIRPLSHRMWAGRGYRVPELGIRAVVVRALTEWTAPPLSVVAVVLVTVLIGSTVSAGIEAGAFAALVSAGVVAACLWSREALRPRQVSARWAAWLRALLLLAIGPLAFGLLEAGGTWLGIVSAQAASLTVASAAFSMAVGYVIVVGITRHRALLLAEMDQLLATGFWRDEVALSIHARQASDAAVFLHHRVQSDLLAAALQLEMAAEQDDPAVVASVLRDVRARFAAAPSAPMSVVVDASTVREVRDDWAGICAVELDLPDDADLPSAMWDRIDLLVREAVANAVRAGGASAVDVRVIPAESGVDVVITDDGQESAGRTPGVGHGWLDTVATRWSFRTTGARRELRAHLSL